MLRLAELDMLSAVHDRRSGQTHLVSAPVPDILAALATPATIDTLAARLGVVDAGAVLEDRIAELLALGLVAPADAP